MHVQSEVQQLVTCTLYWLPTIRSKSWKLYFMKEFRNICIDVQKKSSVKVTLMIYVKVKHKLVVTKQKIIVVKKYE